MVANWYYFVNVDDYEVRCYLENQQVKYRWHKDGGYLTISIKQSHPAFRNVHNYLTRNNYSLAQYDRITFDVKELEKAEYLRCESLCYLPSFEIVNDDMNDDALKTYQTLIEEQIEIGGNSRRHCHAVEVLPQWYYVSKAPRFKNGQHLANSYRTFWTLFCTESARRVLDRVEGIKFEPLLDWRNNQSIEGYYHIRFLNELPLDCVLTNAEQDEECSLCGQQWMRFPFSSGPKDDPCDYLIHLRKEGVTQSSCYRTPSVFCPNRASDYLSVARSQMIVTQEFYRRVCCAGMAKGMYFEPVILV